MAMVAQPSASNVSIVLMTSDIHVYGHMQEIGYACTVIHRCTDLCSTLIDIDKLLADTVVRIAPLAK